ncbi:MAG: hypothetical protein ACHQ2Z_12060 [Elusimicrobiota bacterium]
MNIKIIAAAAFFIPNIPLPAAAGAAEIIPRVSIEGIIRTNDALTLAGPFTVVPAVIPTLIPTVVPNAVPTLFALPRSAAAAAAGALPAPPSPAVVAAGLSADFNPGRQLLDIDRPGGVPSGQTPGAEFDGRSLHEALDNGVAADGAMRFDRDPRSHPQPPKRGSEEEKIWTDGVLGWMKHANDPRGVLDSVAAIGLRFEADGAVLGMTGHQGTFRQPRDLVLSTKRFWGKMYDFPAKGDFAIWNDDAVEIHHASGDVEIQRHLRSTIEEKSRKIIKRMVRDAVDGNDLRLKWRWTQEEVLYFVFYAAREYVTAPNPTSFLSHAKTVSIEQTPGSEEWSYKLRIETNLVHTHSAFQEVYLDKQGRIGRIRYNFDLMDGGKGLMPIVHDIGGYAASKEGLPVPTRRRATIRWDEFSGGIRRLAKRKSGRMLDGLFGPASFVFSPFAAPFAAPVIDGVSRRVVDRVKEEFSCFSDFGMRVDVNDELQLYQDESAVP